MSAVSFPIRRQSGYTPSAPRDSFTRTGYQKTTSNPRGEHRGVDLAAPTNAIIQLPERAKLIDKGKGGDTGYWMEWQILAGPWRNRYARFFHMSRPCGFSIGTQKNRKAAVGRVGCTGNCNGPHVHFELGKTRWDKGRDPRWNPTQAFRDAVVARDY